MNFRFQLRDIIQKHLQEVFKYSASRRENGFLDFNCERFPLVEENSSGILTFNLILFSDGVSIKKSTMKKGLWPIWVQLADLPPRQRMSQKNIVCVGQVQHIWNEIVVPLKGETISHVEVKDKNMRTYRVFFKFKLLVSDLGAKNHILNMFKFNGYFGCHYCTVMGKTIGRTHSYFPFNQTGQIREPLINDVYVNLAQCSDSNTPYNVAGVKGWSPFSSLIDGLPLSAPID